MSDESSKTNIKNLKSVDQIAGTDLVLVSVNGKARRALASLLKGQKGDEVELRITDTHIQWRLTGGTWANLISFAELRGPIEDAGAAAIEAAKKALDAALKADTLNKNVEGNESVRLTNESGRVSAETKRVSAEKNRSTAETGREDAEKKRVSAESGRVTAEENRVKEFGTIKTETSTATGNAKTQADRAKDLADHPTQMGENGNWWKWDLVQKKYIDTGILAKGGVLYPSFDILDDDMCLYMTYEDDIAADQFELDVNGCLNFKFK